MAEKIKLLVTGLNGVVGRALRPALEKRYELSALSRSGVDGLPEERVFKADVADIDALYPAFRGVDVVLNLAADGGQSSAEGMNAGLGFDAPEQHHRHLQRSRSRSGGWGVQGDTRQLGRDRERVRAR